MAMLADSANTPSVQSFSLTNGGTAQLMLAGNQRRQSLYFNAVTETTLLQFGATAGTQATGTLTAGTNPVNTETIVVNGVTFTFVTGASTATNVHIDGSTKEATMANFQAVLAASVNASITLATYAVSGAVITITTIQGGTDGNAYTLANSSGTVAVTRSAAALAGGSNTVGGWTVLTTVPISFNANQYPSIRNDIYVVSPSDAAKSNYLEGFGA